MSSRHRIACVLTSALLAACASAPPAAPPVPPDRWFADALFAPPSVAIDDDIFAPSEAMRAFVEAKMNSAARTRSPREALLEALSREAQLKLSYDTLRTRNAAEAFEARAGNCLSLVVMTASFAELLGVQVRFNSVLVDETWSRKDNVYFASGHVNLTLSRGSSRSNAAYDASEELTVDFLPPQEIRGLRMRTISRDTVLAMYLNNRAAEALAAQQVDDAYWWARRAIERVPRALTAYNTLGVIYQRRGALAQAEAIFRHALTHEPDNTKTLFNLAQLLEQTGRDADAGPLRVRLAALELQPPFQQYDLGMAALKRADYRAAKEHFERELKRASDYHEIHSALAVVTFHLGAYDEAWRYMTNALALSMTERDRAIYTTKADLLRKLTKQN